MSRRMSRSRRRQVGRREHEERVSPTHLDIPIELSTYYLTIYPPINETNLPVNLPANIYQHLPPFTSPPTYVYTYLPPYVRLPTDLPT